jgi:predicted ATPase
MQQSIAVLEAKNVASHVPYFMCLLAEAHARTGDVQSAGALCGDAQKRIRRTEEYIWVAELHRIEGEVRRAAGHPVSDVEACFTSALEVSRRQGAKMFLITHIELRAAISLAKLLRDRGKDTEARDLLAPVYRWFTEGFDTLDLKDAKALLVQLST